MDEPQAADRPFDAARWQALADEHAARQAQPGAQVLAEQSLQAPLGSLLRGELVAVAPGTPLAQALQRMHQRRVGSVLVVDAGGAAVGILTRHDILGRVTLPQLPLATDIDAVMSAPVQALGAQDTAQDAMLLMSRHGIRHVAVTAGGRAVGVVSERDLFALQRPSLKQLGAALRQAADLPALVAGAAEIRRFASQLLGQGIGARQLTELVSHLNDTLTERLVQLMAAASGVDLQRACWLAFGSEGRSEQTIATDQDNGLVFDSADPVRDRPAWLAFAQRVNQGLADCGYPLCRGNVMARNPACCLSSAEWLQRFEHWLDHGAPEDLLNASIYFDLRPVAGARELSEPLRALISQRTPQLPRFLKQMADNALHSRPALSWHGGIQAQRVDGEEFVDLKQGGTAVFVEAARLQALALGVAATGTRARFEAVAQRLHVEPHEAEAWCSAFEFLQMLRLRVQLAAAPAAGPLAAGANRVALAALNDIDRQVLKEALRVARRLQQRLALDYPG
jgi:CBS domain-containing protein